MNKTLKQIKIEITHSSGAYKKKQVQIVKGKNAVVWDSLGNKYIDCIGGHGTANVGHCNKHILKALKKQLEKLVVCPESYCNDTRAELYEKLNKITPKNLTKTFLCNSGTEAVEGAIKIARFKTNRTEIIACMRAFHGRTMGSLSATWEKKYRKQFEPLVPHVKHIPYNNTEKLKEAITKKTAAFIIEPVLGEAGVIKAEKEFLKTARDLCNETNTTLIFDEIQTGFGRTGKMFALQHYKVEPDILCMAKSIAGGLPMGAIQIKKEYELKPGMHGSTFGGNPVVCAAAIATINFLKKQRIPQKAQKKGKYFLKKLKNIETSFESVREARGIGLMNAIEFKKSNLSFLNGMLEKKVLCLPSGKLSVRFLPPLVITKKQLSTVIKKAREVLK